VTTSAKRADPATDQFLAIERDWAGLKDLAAGLGGHLAGGLLWRVHVGSEVSRLAAKAREACGPKRKWSEVEDLAHYAQVELQLIADQHAEEWRGEFPTSTTSGADMIALHGPADVLAWGLLWSLKNQDAPSLKDRPRPSVEAITSNQVVASFALLMIDHAVFDMTKGRPASALEFLSVGASALHFATMDATQSKVAAEAFRTRDAQAVAVSLANRAAADARHGKAGGTRDKRAAIQAAWASGKYSNRDLCAEQECAALGMSYSTARKALRNTPAPA
jgi:hypothetical protein